MLAFSRLAWVRVSNGSNRACGRNLAGCWRFCVLCPCVAVGFGGRSRTSKGFRRFYTQGCRDFCTAFAIYLQGFRRFSVCRRLLGWLAPLGGNCGYNCHYSHLSNHTGAIIPLVTITKVTIPCVIDRHYCLRRAINKSNNKCNVNLS